MLSALIAGVFCLALLLPLFQAYAAGKNSLTIFRYKQAAALHEINKKPEGGEPVAGSVFTLWKVSGETTISAEDYAKKISDLEKMTVATLNTTYPNLVSSGETDSEGKVTIQNLEDGLYYVREKETGKGTIVPFLVPLPLQTEKGPETNVTVYPKKLKPDTPPPPPETPPGEIELTKTDLRGKALEGAYFRLFQKTTSGLVEVPLVQQKDGYRYDLGGRTDLDLVSGKNGKIRVNNLPAGEYVLKEVKAPIGYTAKQTETTVHVDEGKTARLTVTNKPNDTGGFRFQKISADGKKTPLAGAKFAVYVKTAKGWEQVKRDGKALILTSGADGFFELTGVPFGEYALYEIATPKGYVFNDRHIYFTVDATSYDVGKFIPIENKKTPPPPPDKPPVNPPENPPERPPKPPVQTGDPGMTPFILLGGAAFIGVLLIGRKKRNKE